MRRPLTLLLVTLALSLFAPPLRADLGSEVRKALQNKALKPEKVGVEIVRLGETPRQASTVFQHNASTPLIPASNQKLVTTAAAMQLLGRDFRFRTMLTLRGLDVALIGDGDPTLGDAEMLRKVGWDVDSVFQTWAELLKTRNITRIQNLYVDDSVFDEIFVHPNWPVEQQHKRYVAQVGGVNLNVNCVDFFLRITAFGEFVTYTTSPATRYITISNVCATGEKNAVWLARQLGGNSIILRGETNASNREPIAVTVHDPPMYAATVLAETFRAAGIRIDGQVVRDTSIRQQVLDATVAPQQRWTPLAIHETPLSTVLARSNKDSVNLYAESLCKRMGHATTGESGSWANGSAAISGYLQALGVRSSEFNLDDGCGLSKKNAISANAIAHVLAHSFAGENRQAFIDSLSVAGEDGTLNRRFRDSDLRGRVFAKSGYVQGVSALSGYVRTRNDQWYAFSIIMNGVSDIATARMLQETIVAAIDRHSR
jgi:serine-type D-Ala-D-Ala carboxypeptidase/endopeptidase (penicillin-binding protein 4)